MILSKYCLAYQIFIQLTFKKNELKILQLTKKLFPWLSCRWTVTFCLCCSARKKNKWNKISKKIVNIIELQKRFLPFTPGFVILNFNSLFYFIFKKATSKFWVWQKIYFKKRWSPQNFWVIKSGLTCCLAMSFISGMINSFSSWVHR